LSGDTADAHTHAHTHVHAHTYTYAYAHAYAHAHTHAFVCPGELAGSGRHGFDDGAFQPQPGDNRERTDGGGLGVFDHHAEHY